VVKAHFPYTARLWANGEEVSIPHCAADGLPWPCSVEVLRESAMALATLLDAALDDHLNRCLRQLRMACWCDPAEAQLRHLKEITQ